MRISKISSNRRSRQRGVVLFVALILLVILSLIGVTAARMQTVEERMARNEDNRQTGAQASEAALRDAEDGLLSGLYTNFSANANGLYELTPSAGSVVGTFSWQSPPPNTVMTYSGPNLSAIPANAQLPEYVIESLPPVAVPGDSIQQVQYAAPSSPVTVYRITAYGQGADGTSSTTLQSIYR
ncbi:MAG TPA: PilX N-terminal domain-containing pilus assembly protein [Steroidobacteraceae bacterium]|nr:PilX N-terminal domain-containing pilus assembly protein [Steroidobacteraceae bacterium]